MARTACLICFISNVNGHCNKKRKEKKKLTLGGPALAAGTQQTLSNLFWDFRYLWVMHIFCLLLMQRKTCYFQKRVFVNHLPLPNEGICDTIDTEY